MKMRIVLIIAGMLAFGACKTKKMTAVDQPAQNRPLIEKETDVVVEVDRTSGIMSLEERFTFTNAEDKTMHDEKTYFVIMGSFRRKDNAERFKESLKVKGFNPVILLSENGLHRVSVDSYQREADARTRILNIRYEFREHEDTWLLVRK
jgi:cell division protein FtsN